MIDRRCSMLQGWPPLGRPSKLLSAWRTWGGPRLRWQCCRLGRAAAAGLCLPHKGWRRRGLGCASCCAAVYCRRHTLRWVEAGCWQLHLGNGHLKDMAIVQSGTFSLQVSVCWSPLAPCKPGGLVNIRLGYTCAEASTLTLSGAAGRHAERPIG